MSGPGPPDAKADDAHPLQELADVRQRHHQRFREREEKAAEEQRKQELRQQEEQDAVLAEQFAKEEEEARLRQLEADEEYSRQLAAHLNPGGSHPLQEFRGQAADANSMAEDAELAHYQQLEDSEAEGYRAPMRTGYVDRLIDTPQDLSWAWAMLQGQGDSAMDDVLLRGHGDFLRCHLFPNRSLSRSSLAERRLDTGRHQSCCNGKQCQNLRQL